MNQQSSLATGQNTTAIYINRLFAFEMFRKLIEEVK
jgi:hypothetical protein